MHASEQVHSAEFTAEELNTLDASWPGGIRLKFPERDIFEVWFTGFGPAMTFTKTANGEIVVADLMGEFMTSGTNLQEVIRSVMRILELDLSEMPDATTPHAAGRNQPQTGRRRPR